ncbi:hypothetical protein EBS43_12145, partial [bacterium]|nr:hypothetical protein [bacterium]
MAENHLLPSQESYVEISSSALEHNVRVFRKLISPQSKLGVVLKGNAYGHGLEVVLSVVYPHVDCFY